MWCCTTFATTNRMHSANCDVPMRGSCPNHRLKAHDAEGLLVWCDFCGRNADGEKVGKAAGGWGTTSPVTP